MKKNLTLKDIEVCYEFLKTGKRVSSFKKIYPNTIKTDIQIYRFFNNKLVLNKIVEIGKDLEIYDAVADKVLLKIITDDNSENKDKIAAIKVWNDLRKRTEQNIKIEAIHNLDFTKVSDENLEKLVNKIIELNDINKSNN